MAGHLTRIRNLLAPPVFDDAEGAAVAVESNQIALVLLAVVNPGLIVLALAMPAIGPLLWVAIAWLCVMAVFMLVATRFGLAALGLGTFLVGTWAMTTWIAWLSGGLFSSAVFAQFLVVAIAEASRGWRWSLPLSVLSVVTVAGLVWAQMHQLVPPSILVTTPATFGAAVIASLVGLTVVHALLGVRQRLAEAGIRQMAFHDELTGLPNRKLLLDRLMVALNTARRRGSGVALLYIDLDRFKPLNDRYGHAFGDLVLSAVAQRLRQTARASDTLARIGGDEFTLLMPDVTNPEQVETVAAKLVEAFREPLEVSGQLVHITASIGMTISIDHDLDPQTLIDKADTAMYEMKRSGRNGYRVA